MLAAMHPVLEQLQLEFERGLEGLTPAQAQLRTEDDPGRWSVQQIVEHLLMTYDLSADTFEQRIAQGRPTQARPTLKQWLGQIVVVRLGRFPQGRKAPVRVMPGEPKEALSGVQLSGQTRERLQRFDAAAAKAEALFGQRRAITHAVLGPMSVWGWRRFHLTHGEHHLKQMAAIRSAHGCLR